MAKLIDLAGSRFGWRGATVLPDEYFETGPSVVTIDASITEDAQTVTALSGVPVKPAATITESPQTATASTGVGLSALGNIAEAAQTVTSSGLVLVSGRGSINEASQTVTSASQALIESSATLVEQPETSISNTGVLVGSDSDTTETPDNLNAFVHVGDPVFYDWFVVSLPLAFIADTSFAPYRCELPSPYVSHSSSIPLIARIDPAIVAVVCSALEAA